MGGMQHDLQKNTLHHRNSCRDLVNDIHEMFLIRYVVVNSVQCIVVDSKEQSRTI